jgi:hypothetical protein
MTVTDVARHFQLGLKTVKDIDKHYLEAHYGQPDYNELRILTVDEISIRKGQASCHWCCNTRLAASFTLVKTEWSEL